MAKSRHWTTKVVLLVLLGCLGGGCVEGEQEEAKTESDTVEAHTGKPDSAKSLTADYWLFVRLIDFAGNYTLLVNGFPVEREPVNFRSSDQKIGARLNTALIGEDNVASIRVDPYMQKTGTGVKVSPVRLEGWIAREAEDGSHVPIRRAPVGDDTLGITTTEVDSIYQAWMERAQKKLEELGSQDGALDSMRAWAARHPMTVSVTFDNEAGPDYSRIFEEAPVIEDSSRLKDYAMHLRDLLLAEQPKQIYAELRPSVAEETGAYQVAHEPGREAAVAYIRTEWIPNWETDFARSDVRVRRWCEGRVWELRKRGPGGSLEPLLHSEHSHLKVYVAEIGGELRIVRLTA
jgi:hypothetical protein